MNKETQDDDGSILPGLGIINPPPNSKKDLILYPKSATICYEIKAGGTTGEQIHWFFFSRMSTGAITFPIKCAEAISLYSRNKTFAEMSVRKQQEFLLPFKMMDMAEEELRNLDVVNSSDQLASRLRIARRNMNIQKDFFSMFEYTV